MYGSDIANLTIVGVSVTSFPTLLGVLAVDDKLQHEQDLAFKVYTCN